MPDNIELRASVTSDSKPAQQDLNKLTEAMVGVTEELKAQRDQAQETGHEVEDLGDKQKEAGDKSKGFSLSLTDLFQIGHLVSKAFKEVNDVIGEGLKRAAADGDKGAQALLGGFDKLQETLGDVTSAFAEDFAPAILPVVNLFADLAKQVADWAKKTDAGKTLAKGLIDVILVLGEAFNGVAQGMISALVKIMQISADVASVWDNELANSIDIQAQQVKKFGQQWEDTASKVLDQVALIESGQKELTQAEIDAYAARSDAAQKHSEALAKLAEEQKKRDEEAIQAADEAAQRAEQSILAVEAIRQKAADDEKRRGEEGQKALDARARKFEQAQKDMAESAKQSADKQAKAAEEAKKKITERYQEMFGILKTATTDWKAAAGQLWDLITKNLIAALTQQTVATQAFIGAKNSAEMSGAAQHVAAKATENAADDASLVHKLASAYAGIPFAGPALAAAGLALFLGFIRKHIGFEEGGPVRDRVPGLGRQDTVPGQLGADEGVLTGKGMATTLGEILGAVNRGGLQGAPALAGAGGGSFKLEIGLADVPSDSELVRWIMGKINFRVLNQNGELVSSHFHTRNGRKL